MRPIEEQKRLLCDLVDRGSEGMQYHPNGAITDWVSYRPHQEANVAADIINFDMPLRPKPETVTVYVWQGTNKTQATSWEPPEGVREYYTFEHEIDEDKLK